MKRLILLFILSLAFAASASATQITVAGGTINTNWNPAWGALARIRIVSNDDFFPANETYQVLRGSAANSAFYRDVSCALNGAALVCTQLDIDATTDSSNPTATYTAYLYDSKNIQRAVFLANFRVPTNLGKNVAWAQLAAYNKTAPRPPTPGFYNADQTNQQISNAIAASPLAAVGASGDPGLTYLQSFQSLKTIADTSGSTDTPLVVPAATTVSVNTVLPPNVRLKFGAKGYATINSGVTLEIQNCAAIDADPTQYIFRGAGQVICTKTAPQGWFPEWFGAVGNGGIGAGAADDVAAFERMFASMRTGANAYRRGGLVLLKPGAEYYMSRTFNVTKDVEMGCNHGYAGQSACGFRFPVNTTGLIVHGFTTIDGTSSGDINLQTFGGGTYLHGFYITGGGETAGSNTTVSTATTGGIMRVTLTGGITQVSRFGNNSGSVPAIQPGTSITINGYTYLIDADGSETGAAALPNIALPGDPLAFGAGVSTFALMKPQVLLSCSSTNYCDSPPDTGAFPQTDDWVGQQVFVGGAYHTITSVSSNSLGTPHARLNFADNVTPGVGYGVVQGIKTQSGVAANLNIYHGIDQRIKARFENLLIRNFAGDGINVAMKFPSAYRSLETEPNSDNSKYDSLEIINNAGNGILFDGTNAANNSVCSSINASSNYGWGIIDHGGGCTVINPHFSADRQGGYWDRQIGAQGMLINPYTEGDHPPICLGQGTLALGGIAGGGYDPRCSLNTLTAASGQLQSLGGLKYLRLKGYGGAPVSLMTVLGGRKANFYQLFGFGAADESINEGNVQANEPAYTLNYQNGIYRLDYNQTSTVLTLTGSQSGAGGLLGLPGGFTAGTSALYRRWRFLYNSPDVSALGAGTSAEIGDVYWLKADDSIGYVTDTDASRIPFGAKGITRGLTVSATLTFGTFAGGTIAEQFVALSGAAAGQACFWSPSAALPSGVMNAGCRVSAAGVVAISVANISGASATVPGTLTGRVWAIR